MHEIFISYRRSDSEGQAGRLFRDLSERFGRDSVLLDVAGLEKGRDFRRTIERRLANCKVLLALIGRSWLDSKDESGARRLDQENDLVRVEIEAALKRDIPVIPVLVGGASMPRAADMPGDLTELVFRDGAEVTHARWDSDVQLLIQALEAHLPAHVNPQGLEGNPPPGGEPLKTRLVQVTAWAVAVVALAAAGIGGLWAYENWQTSRAEADKRAIEAAAEWVAADKLAAEKAAEKLALERAAAQQAAEKAAADKQVAGKEAAKRVAETVAGEKAADKGAARRSAAEKAEVEKAAEASLNWPPR